MKSFSESFFIILFNINNLILLKTQLLKKFHAIKEKEASILFFVEKF
jgi:hypothetical protein